ncbi:long-subunit acyl-CoA synthetase (AMP-forming) [Nocardia tenerifensis]|uniref:Acyl-CoA synthetase n=1 Tax=Nocardia tenerifensis TaxID=228006 RepID=A0A318K827_9NOCA|nr:AMP-binding protein [Nocardia tenerifensis]PXX69265.1 long-subunit acyl-CoA synthetase (AMP-forming) [Nocardia tenerifensis]
MRSVINRIVTTPPPAGCHATFARLGSTETIELRELSTRAANLAVALRDMGIRPGDRIGILAANCLEWVLLDLAALRCKAVTAGLEPGKFEADAALLARYDLKLLFTDQSSTAAGVRPIREIRDLAVRSTGTLPEVEYGPEEATTLKFTSGSTGVPKGLAASVGSIDSSLRAVQTMFAHGPGDHLFVFLPLSLLQQRYWVYSALCFGHDVTISTYEAAFTTMRQVRPTVVMGVPGFYETVKRHLEAQADPQVAAKELFGDRIRYLWTGSAPAGADMLRFFTSLGLPIYEGYGMNETCIVAKNHPGASRVGSVGRVVPGKEVLFDADGVISVRSEYPVARRYEYGASGPSMGVFGADGTVRTGDIGYLDDDGFLYIRGRADDVIVLANGKKVIVRPIEERMAASPAIEHCVIFCPTQNSLVAVVSPTGEPADEKAIAEHLARTNAELERDERIDRVVIAKPRFSIDNGLLSSQYKPKRRQIREQYRVEIGEKGSTHA